MSTRSEEGVMDVVTRQFGRRLRDLRLKRGPSQESLAHLANLDRSYIGGVERGERNISLRNIAKIADALEISIEDFFADVRGS